MNVRTIPYGYRYENGAVTINPDESNIIQRIFSEYLHGQSLLNIAADLNTDCIEYRPGVIGWNKSRIMRLIEDERYIGTDTFPALITQSFTFRIDKTFRRNPGGFLLFVYLYKSVTQHLRRILPGILCFCTAFFYPCSDHSTEKSHLPVAFRPHMCYNLNL